MRESIRETILSTVNDLYNSGIVDEVTQKEMESLCLPEIKKYSPHLDISEEIADFSDNLIENHIVPESE